MNSSFSTALSALSATSAAVSVVGNNLANLNTTGYKAENAHFADLMSTAIGASDAQPGMGVGPLKSVRQFAQGAIQQTSGALDAAIQGNGFFVLRGQDNQQLFTRAGNFAFDSTGRLRTASGAYVQGWSAANGVVNTNSAASDIAIPVNGVLPASPTKSMSLTLNLDSAGAVGKDSGTYSAPIKVVDSLGGTHTLTVTFTKTASNKWDYAVNVPSGDLTSPTDPPTPLATGSLEFDGSGALKTPAASDKPISITLAGLANGASDLKLDWNLFGSDGTALVTQFAEPSSLSASSQDGVLAGQITKVGIIDGGRVVASFSNGMQTTVGQLALVSIQNPETLVSVGNNNLRASADTSTPALGVASAGGRGDIVGNALEQSTVDIATEFTNLITYQRSYQANSRVISTADQMTQDLLTVVR